MVDRVPVTSSTIKSVGYLPNENTLAVEFKDGSVYHYHDVPKEVHDGLVGAKSVGSYLHNNVKGSYKHSKQ